MKWLTTPAGKFLIAVVQPAARPLGAALAGLLLGLGLPLVAEARLGFCASSSNKLPLGAVSFLGISDLTAARLL